MQLSLLICSFLKFYQDKMSECYFLEYDVLQNAMYWRRREQINEYANGYLLNKLSKTFRTIYTNQLIPIFE